MDFYIWSCQYQQTRCTHIYWLSVDTECSLEDLQELRVIGLGSYRKSTGLNDDDDMYIYIYIYIYIIY